MARQFDDVFVSLAIPFEGDEVRTRSQGGREMSYITARSAMNRLDDVLGPANWWDEYQFLEKSVLCKLSIRLPDGTVLTKPGLGGYADMQDEGDGEKAGESDAFKRAAVKFGVGRHLYGDGVPAFVRHMLNRDDDPELLPKQKGYSGGGSYGGGRSNGGGYQSQAPSRGRDEVNRQFPNGSGQQGGRNDDAPRTGGALYAWASKQTEANPSLDLVKRIDAWAKQKDFPYKWKEWTGEQVAQGYATAMKAIGGGQSQPAPQGQPIPRDYAPNGDGPDEDIPF